MRAETFRSLGLDQAAKDDLEQVVAITRARLEEAERSLGRTATRQAPTATVQPAPGPGPAVAPTRPRFARSTPGPLHSPIIRLTLAVTAVAVLGALVVLVIG